MCSDFDIKVFKAVWSAIDLVVPPQVEVSGILCCSPAGWPILVLPCQTLPSLQHGHCVPQREYTGGVSPDSPLELDRVLFFLQDGSLLPVNATLDKTYPDLIGGDEPALSQPTTNVTLRIEVSRPNSTALDDDTMLIGRPVAGIPLQGLPGELDYTM
jgi:hypothetical protein